MEISGTMISNEIVEFDPITSEAALHLSMDSRGHYAVIVKIESDPMQYFMEATGRVEVISDVRYADVIIEMVTNVEFRYNVDYDLIMNKEQDVIVDDIELFVGNY